MTKTEVIVDRWNEPKALIITMYDGLDRHTQVITNEDELARISKAMNDITFEPLRLPRFTYRVHHLKGPQGTHYTAWTTELNEPEIGNDSAMEEGMNV